MIIAAVAASTPPVIPNYGGPPGGKHGCIAQNGTFCWDWVKGHWGDILQPRLLEHLELTAIAVGIGFAIAFAAALLAHRKRWFETPFGAFSAFLYTIPSLALFQLLVPFTGLTMLTIEIGLVGYTLLVLLRNLLAGLDAVPEDVRDAAVGMGFNRWRLFSRVELPLALPALFAGIRVATVTTIGLVTWLS